MRFLRPAARISVGLVSLTLFVILLADFVLGMLCENGALPQAGLAWLASPLARAMVGVALFGSALYYWYMRRVLEQLDPTPAIPDRVRKALDTLTEGVIVVDIDGRVVLA